MCCWLTLTSMGLQKYLALFNKLIIKVTHFLLVLYTLKLNFILAFTYFFNQKFNEVAAAKEARQ